MRTAASVVQCLALISEPRRARMWRLLSRRSVIFPHVMLNLFQHPSGRSLSPSPKWILKQVQDDDSAVPSSKNPSRWPGQADPVSKLGDAFDRPDGEVGGLAAGD